MEGATQTFPQSKTTADPAARRMIFPQCAAPWIGAFGEALRRRPRQLPVSAEKILSPGCAEGLGEPPKVRHHHGTLALGTGAS